MAIDVKCTVIYASKNKYRLRHCIFNRKPQSKFLILKVTFVYFGGAHVWRSEDNIWGSVLSHVGPGDRTQVVRLGCKCLDPLSHYICPATPLTEQISVVSTCRNWNPCVLLVKRWDGAASGGEQYGGPSPLNTELPHNCPIQLRVCTCSSSRPAAVINSIANNNLGKKGLISSNRLQAF